MGPDMDTECGLPIPIHRTIAYAGPQQVIPLPLRHNLDQITEISTENSAPYTSPTPLSRLEILPFEIRLMIWSYLEVVSMTKALEQESWSGWSSPKYTNDTLYAHDNSWYPWAVVRKILSLNTNIRGELLHLMSKGAGERILHHLSSRIVFDYRRQLPVSQMRRMLHAGFSFGSLRRVYLGCCYQPYDKKPHSFQVSRTQVRRPIVRRAESIRFVADHSPLLESLQVVVTPWPRDNSKGREAKRAIRFCELEPMILALKYTAQKCPRLETLRAVTPVQPCEVHDASMTNRQPGTHEEIRGLDLAAIPVYLRDDLIQAWADTTLREVIERGTENRYLSGPEYDWWQKFRWNLEDGDWQSFRMTVLDEFEFEDWVLP